MPGNMTGQAVQAFLDQDVEEAEGILKARSQTRSTLR